MMRFNRGIKTVETRPLTPLFDLLGEASAAIARVCSLVFLCSPTPLGVCL